MIETSRLYLRPWKETDAESLYRYASEEKVSEMALWPRHTSVDMSRQVIRDFFMPNPATFAMVDKETNLPIGCIGLVPAGEEHFTTSAKEREVGYWIGLPYWGRGLTTEALNALTGLCRESKDIESLLITTDVRNVASQRVAEKCGFMFIADYVSDGIPSKAYRLCVSSVMIIQ